MNLQIFKGRLVRDPEIRYKGETAIANYSIAVDRRYKKEGEATADFFNITAFNKQAELIEKHMRKGSEILVTCRAQNNDWTDKDGVKHYDIQFLQETMDFCGSKVAETQPQSTTSSDGFMNIPEGLEDELPFV